jgi:hypothetical protein
VPAAAAKAEVPDTRPSKHDSCNCSSADYWPLGHGFLLNMGRKAVSPFRLPLFGQPLCFTLRPQVGGAFSRNALSREWLPAEHQKSGLDAFGMETLKPTKS